MTVHVLPTLIDTFEFCQFTRMSADMMQDDAPAIVAEVSEIGAELPQSKQQQSQKKQQQQQSQQQQRRPPALKGEDAWKRMNYLYQSSHCILSAQSSSSRSLSSSTRCVNLSRFYLMNMKKIAAKLVMRLSPAIKNSACKRCGALLIVGHSADIQVVEAGEAERYATAEELKLSTSTPSATASPLNPSATDSSATMSDTLGTSAQPAAATQATIESGDAKSTEEKKKRKRKLRRHRIKRKSSESNVSHVSVACAPSVVSPSNLPSAATKPTSSSSNSTTSGSTPATSALSSSSSLSTSFVRSTRRSRPVNIVLTCRTCSTKKRMHTKEIGAPINIPTATG